jgi:hypothetical protein
MYQIIKTEADNHKDAIENLEQLVLSELKTGYWKPVG